MLLDELLPRYDVIERQVTVVRAAPDAADSYAIRVNVSGDLTWAVCGVSGPRL